ncbi:DNA primase [Pontivivens insulae]|uniref:DNA primase n=1 Tax=Pontivivens insulae TaxID=1639689 RepID=A0A2R8ABP1_9RHOB|nr:DNA primase [Pontivivens insulae]RED11170.1 DNA primase [Pontivivens insulae]SPF29656.1 DNA primase [Pontivivens insulae]
MALPPSFFDEIRARVSLSDIVGRKVTWDQRKSNPGKGDMWAPCPFHQEKTASFHVDDRKGFYYCFGCHAKGDVIKFVRETDNLEFMDAMEMLAGEAGLTMPARDPMAAKKAEALAGLSDVVEATIKFYRAQLSGGQAAEARAYLDRRGLRPETLDRFEIGYAPTGRTVLLEHLKAKGLPLDLILGSGMVARSDRNDDLYDRFAGRIVFPIRDGRGRAISLGGRAMDPNARAKYLNGPETELFDKGNALYNHGPAREAAGKASALIVAEGYMDVIALTQAGLGHAVAPLGTAITEGQLRLMWRVADEPVIALDGDAAGIRAARRLIDIALPLLVPGKTLRFCLMPEGQDPDDVVKSGGAGAMTALLDTARPMVDLLWERETEGKIFDSPERRAALDAQLRRLLGTITDPSIKSHYGAALREKRQALFGSGSAARSDGGGRRSFGGTPWRSGSQQIVQPSHAARTSFLARADDGPQAETRARECAILTGCLNHPELARKLEAELERMPMLCGDLEQIRDALLYHLLSPLHADATAAYAAMEQRLGFDPISQLTAIRLVSLPPHLQRGADAPLAERALREEIAKQVAVAGILAEVRDAEEDLQGVADEGLTWRLQQANLARDRAMRGSVENDAAEGGEQELSDHLSRLIAEEVWIKKS